VEYLLQILEKKQPKYFVFENVKGLMSKKFDEFRHSIFERIEKAGYQLNYKVLNTKDF
jgi:DNA (cytosine-5)-methyltransferase 1